MVFEYMMMTDVLYIHPHSLRVNALESRPSHSKKAHLNPYIADGGKGGRAAHAIVMGRATDEGDKV